MAANPLVAQGTLNRLRASVIWNDFPALNVTAPYLHKEGIRLALEGESTLLIPTMTGTVTSPEPYQMISCTINLLKTQALADLYKRQMEADSRLGSGVVRPDASTLSPYEIVNCAIESVRELNFAGDDAGYAVSVKGYYIVNNNLWG
jgi:hypothetical protein